MKPKRARKRHHYHRSQYCAVTGKLKLCKRAAARVSCKIKQENNRDVSPYLCRHCNHWHMSSYEEGQERVYWPGIGRVTIKHFD